MVFKGLFLLWGIVCVFWVSSPAPTPHPQLLTQKFFEPSPPQVHQDSGSKTSTVAKLCKTSREFFW